DNASGVDWAQATKIGYSLLLSPLIGFGAAALLLIVLKLLVRKPELYSAPKGAQPPPLWIRGLLILTCTGVSFAHGSNDGQKGMGLIMLILIGVVPAAYALNRAVPDGAMPAFVRASSAVIQTFDPNEASASIQDPRAVVSAYLRSRTWDPRVVPAVAALGR